MCNQHESYPPIYAKNGDLKHSGQCAMAFGKKDERCPRCRELLAGAAPRDGWQKDHFVEKKRDEENRTRWIKEHSCEKSGCGSVCTAFEW